MFLRSGVALNPDPDYYQAAVGFADPTTGQNRVNIRQCQRYYARSCVRSAQAAHELNHIPIPILAA